MNKNILLIFFFCILITQIKAQLNGIFTIGGTAPDYATINAAVTDLSSSGVSGSVTFNIRSGTYAEKVQLGIITGTSSNNVVTFQSEVGDSTTVILTDTSTSTTGNNFTLQLLGASHIIFKQITIQRTGTGTYATVISLDQNAVGNRFLNNRIVGTIATTSTTNNCLINSPSGSSGVDSNTVISNNYLENGSYGIYMYGHSTSIHEGGNVVTMNTFMNQYARGVYMTYQSAPQINGNLIHTNSSYASWYGVYVSSSDKGTEVIKNKIIHSNSSGYGVYLTSLDGNVGGGEVKVYNNFIHLAGSATTYGMYLNANNNINIYYNSVNVTSTGATSRCFYLTGTDTNVRVLNNVLANNGGGYAYYVVTAAQPGIVISDNNDLYSTGASLGYWGTTALATLLDWQNTTTHDLHSVSADPIFYSPSDLHSSSSVINNAGTPVSGITTDIDSETRHASTPDIGADEFLPLADNVGVMGLISPLSGTCGDSSTQFAIVLKNFGSNTQTGFPVAAVLTGAVSQTLNGTYSGTLPTNASDTFYFSQTAITASGGTIDITAYSALPGDQYLTNDTIQTSRLFYAAPDAPSVVSPQQQCDNNVDIFATPDSNEVLFWYDQPSGGNLLHIGNPFSPVVSADTTFYVEAHEGSGSGGCLRIAECGIGGTNDFFEIQNLSGSAFDATGWVAIISDSYTDMNLVNANMWNLGLFAPGEIQYKSDNTSDNYWGSNMFWNPGSDSWAMIIDNAGNIVDYVPWGWTGAEIQTLNIVVNGYPITIGQEWIGDGPIACPAPNTVSRTGNSDNNTVADFACESDTKGLQNANLAPSFNNCGTGLCPSPRIPVEINLVPGITVDLGNDTILTIPFSYVINAGAGFNSYEWSTGETTQSITVTSGNIYWVTVTGGPNNCSYTDTILVNFIVGINDPSDDELEIHPNPATGFITISGINSANKPEEIRISDLQGRILIMNSPNENVSTQTIDLSWVADGVYFVEFISDGSRITRQLIIQH